MAKAGRHDIARLVVLCVFLAILEGLAIYAPSKPGEPPTFCTAFNHMVKSGGTSIKDHLISASMRAGHVPPDQPINRPPKWCGNMPHELSLEERLLEFVRRTAWSRISFRQMMFGINCPEDFEICEKGVEPTKPIQDPLSADGQRALRKMEGLLSSYKAIGIFEHWELSMRLFDATVTSSVREWTSSSALNPGPASPARDELLNWAFTNPDIHSALAADLMLYQFSLTVFKQQTRDALGTRWPM